MLPLDLPIQHSGAMGLTDVQHILLIEKAADKLSLSFHGLLEM
jgi:hypothetical protein